MRLLSPEYKLMEMILLHRGTRQGCQLSPLLIALALEPLTAIVRTFPDIEVFRQWKRVDKISLYADDTWICLGDAVDSLEAVMHLIEWFGRYSRFAIYWYKSSLLLLDPLESAMPKTAGQVEVVQSFRYLGIEVPGNPRDYGPDSRR